MTGADFRRIALSMPEAVEGAHFGNADFRVGGKIFATLALDVFKGWLPVFLVLTLPIPTSGPAQLHTLATFAALVAVVGHMFPVWLGFKGGKGVATGLGAFLAIAPLAVLPAVVVFLAVMISTRYVSLGSMLGAATFPVAVWCLQRDSFPPAALAMCAAVALLVIQRHHQNIGRLLAGTENRFGAKKA